MDFLMSSSHIEINFQTGSTTKSYKYIFGTCSSRAFNNTKINIQTKTVHLPDFLQ